MNRRWFNIIRFFVFTLAAIAFPSIASAQNWNILAGPNDAPSTDLFNPNSSFTIVASNQAYPSPTSLASEFTLPNVSSSGSSADQTLSTACNYTDTYTDGLTSFNPSLRFSGQSGTISRSGSYVQRSTYLTGMKGLAIRASFSGTGGGGTILVQSVFYHSQRCFDAGTEFGFQRLVDGTHDGTIQFYYATNANCPTSGAVCQLNESGTWTTIGSSDINTWFFDLNLPNDSSHTSCVNSQNGTDWLYEAWVTSPSSGVFKWNFAVIDPYNYGTPPSATCAQQPSTLSTTIDSGWKPLAAANYSTYSGYADAIVNGSGLAGYVTATSNLNSGSPYSSPGPTMTIIRMWAP